MERITQLGTELAMLLRREHQYLEEMRRIGEQISALTKQIQEDSTRTLYATGGFPVIRPASMDGPVSHIVQCPDAFLGVDETPACLAEGPHVHTADGEVHPTRLVET